jgi:methyl coenzyme M reductase beta subunit
VNQDRRVNPHVPTCSARNAGLVRRILDDRAALYLWLSAIPVGAFAMYAVADFRMFLIAWAAAGLAAAVLVDVKVERRR